MRCRDWRVICKHVIAFKNAKDQYLTAVRTRRATEEREGEHSAAKMSRVSPSLLERLAALRVAMAGPATSLSAYIVPTPDAHESEYIAEVDARREWLTGFTGSAGLAVVTPTEALVWTDGRYYTQFEKEVDLSVWTLMKQSLPETPSYEKWLASNLPDGAVVGTDPYTMTRDEWTPLSSALQQANMRLIALSHNLVDLVRDRLKCPPPPRPQNPVIPLPLKYSGKPAGQKVRELRDQMKEKKASALIITSLDEVAYTLNLRGSDIKYNPVFFSYLIITPTKVQLFYGSGEMTADVKEQLTAEGVDAEILPYSQMLNTVQRMARELSESGDVKQSVWLPSACSEAVHRAATLAEGMKNPLRLISDVSPVALMKLVKNETELEGFRQCHIHDGIALIRFFRWLHEHIDAGEEITEVQVADKLLEFRKEEPEFVGLSFETIAGAGEHGAVIHYSASPSGLQTLVKQTDMLLLDSGGQYRNGTTDITRTRHMSEASAEQKDAFTRVLKGQIMMGSALFPSGVKGNVLDSFARKSLWDVGLDYGHGTGHGVGHYLNVHEGPCGVSWRHYPRDPGLRPGYVLSNEPGYYKKGEYGIRHEDLVETIPVTRGSEHPRAAGLVGDFEGRGIVGFHTLSMVPHQTKCLDVMLLDDFEINYINSYHQKVLDVIGPILKERGLNEDYNWLENECKPISRQ